MGKRFTIPHTFTIVFFIVVACAILTWVVPGGEFQRDTDGNVIEGTYHQVESQPQTWQIFTAFFAGFQKASNIIVFILMIGGAFWILNETNAVTRGIYSFLDFTRKLQRFKPFEKMGVNNLVIILIILLFSSFGAIFGMSEETLAFVAIFVPLAISMGYDSVTGVLMCYVAAHVGFAGALFNPFTIGIAQGLSELQPFSGLGYRLICWLILTLIAIVFTLWYANRVKRHPEKSFMHEADSFWRDKVLQQQTQEHCRSTHATWIVFGLVSALLLFLSIRFPFTDITLGDHKSHMPIFPIVAALFTVWGVFAAKRSSQSYIMSLLFLTIVMLVVGVLGYGWYVQEIAALFFAMGIAAGFAYGLRFDKIIRQFLEGCKDMLNAALIVGMAGGIIIILQDGHIVDTLLHGSSTAVAHSGKEGALGGIYLIQNLLNLIIPSGSAKAALTIPMMAEWSDLMGVSRQLTVLAFQFGDGFTNMITPTSGVLIGVLGVARIPYAKWFKFVWPLILGLILLGFILLLPPLFMPFAGF